jgi:hypothetical protein
VPISGKEMRKLFAEAGYESVPGGGKGDIGSLRKMDVLRSLFQTIESLRQVQSMLSKRFWKV